MIFLKLLITLFISCYFNTVYSFTNPTELKKYYKENIKEVEKVGFPICKFKKKKWAGVCHMVFQKLREDKMYKYKLFVSYKPFFDFNKPLKQKCMKNKFFFVSSIEQIGNSEGLMQNMVSCFARPALVESDIYYKDYEYYNEFMIFPASQDSVHVFKRIPNSEVFYLLERCKGIKWKEDSIAVNPKLFILPPPMVINGNDLDLRQYLADADLLAMSSDRSNVLYTEDEQFILIRTTVMKYFETDSLYVCTIDDLAKVSIKFPKICSIVFHNPNNGQNTSKNIRAYGVPTLNPKITKRKKPSYNWKIAPAISPDSVFVLGRCRGGSFQIVALVKNLYSEYISYIV